MGLFVHIEVQGANGGTPKQFRGVPTRWGCVLRFRLLARAQIEKHSPGEGETSSCRIESLATSTHLVDTAQLV